MVSGAAFLYFADEQIVFTLHPSVSTFLTGIDPFEFFQFVDQRQPPWAKSFFGFIGCWKAYRASLNQTNALLEPLRGTAFRTVWLSYPRGADAWESATDLLSSSSLSANELLGLIDRFSAADELFSHLFFEKYLELYFPTRTPEEFLRMGADALRLPSRPGTTRVDWSALYRYCDQTFGTRELGQLLTTAYMFRMPLLRPLDSILLSNERLITLLASLPVEARGPAIGEDRDPLDPIAWEFFRQLVSPILDPLDKGRIRKLQKLRTRGEEIQRLKNRCLILAQELGAESRLEVVKIKIRDHIRSHVASEVQAVLEIDSRALSELMSLVFSDEKVWAGISLALFSLVNGGPSLTAASAIVALSSFGSKAFKSAASKREKLKASDYALIYRMKGP